MKGGIAAFALSKVIVLVELAVVGDYGQDLVAVAGEHDVVEEVGGAFAFGVRPGHGDGVGGVGGRADHAGDAAGLVDVELGAEVGEDGGDVLLGAAGDGEPADVSTLR